MLPPASPEQNMQRAILVGFALGLFATAASAAPDEEKLGKAQHYPVGTAGTWLHEELRVGSFTHQGEIPGIYRGIAHVLAPSPHPLPLPRAPAEPPFRWSSGAAHDLSVDDYLARQRIMGLLIVKDGVVVLERYQYERTPADRFNSQSMGKSINALGIGIALGEGRIRSLDDRAEDYAPKLKGTLYGGTRLRDLLHMASGAKYLQTYDFTGDTGRFNTELGRVGVEGAAQIITERAAPAGTLFHYASAESTMLGAALRGAVGTTLSAYLTPRLWQAIGAETSALWRADRTDLEVTLGNFNATLRDYARLGVVLAYDGVRPDAPERQIIPREYLLDATDWHRQPPAFRPGKAHPYWGYGYQFWLFPGEHRRFAMLGVYGQSIFVDPGQRLVMVETGVNATPEAGQTTLDRERTAFWRGVVSHYGKW
jgi:CubicO group peptidase (beta-lactamase class C family)